MYWKVKEWLAVVMNMTHSYTKSLLVLKHGSIVVSWRVNGRVWNGYIQSFCKKRLKGNHLQENLCLQFFFGTKWDAYWHAKTSNSEQIQRTAVKSCCVFAW
jgi:hypothetical protein